jgi:hypothetical protein
MSPEVKSANQQLSQERLEAEWANVGLCAGMFRPVGSAGRFNGSAHSEANRPNPKTESDWQPHNRCCF